MIELRGQTRRHLDAGVGWADSKCGPSLSVVIGDFLRFQRDPRLPERVGKDALEMLGAYHQNGGAPESR